MPPSPTFRAASLCFLAAALPGMAVAQDGCPPVGARYRLAAPQDAGLTLELAVPSQTTSASDGLDLLIRAPGWDPFAFATWQSMGYGTTTAHPRLPDGTLDPDQDARIVVLPLVTDPAGRLVASETGAVTDGVAAPDALVVAGLAATLWYQTNIRPDAVAPRDAVWYRVDCGPQPP